MSKKIIGDKELDEQIKAATGRGEETLRREPQAKSISYRDGKLFIELKSGWGFNFDPNILPELKTLSPKVLADVNILGQGLLLEWTAADVHIGIGEIITALLGEAFLRSQTGKINGRVKSPVKAAVARLNGKRGGRRPRLISELNDEQKKRRTRYENSK